MLNRSLTIVCAHLAEGMPFVVHFNLIQDADDSNLYTGSNVRLVITGQGTTQCRKTLDRVFGTVSIAETDIWLNFGIAGFRQDDQDGLTVKAGTLVWVSQVDYQDNAWTLKRQVPCDSNIEAEGHLRTVDTPERDFKDPVLYDMECAAVVEFLSEKQRLSCLAVVKMTTDGPELSDAGAVHLGKRLLEDNQTLIAHIGEALIHSESGAVHG